MSDELRDTRLWQVLDWSLWGNGLGDVLRESMADVMVAALSEEQRGQAEACIKAWHERRGPSMAVGVGTALQAERDALSAELDEMKAERARLVAPYVDEKHQGGSWEDIWHAQLVEIQRLRGELDALRAKAGGDPS